jgi:hypothetical protein
MTKVCLGIDSYENFFLEMKEKAGTDEKFPPINAAVLNAINRRHFVNNADLLHALKPIVDVIGLLESPKQQLLLFTLH